MVMVKYSTFDDFIKKKKNEQTDRIYTSKK